MLRTLKNFEKCAIAATDGDIGCVKDLYFDDRAWVIRYLIVDSGSWLINRQVLISPISVQKADWVANKLITGITREQVKNSPNIDTDKPVSRQHEIQTLGYYGYAMYWGGPGMWSGGMVPNDMAPQQAELPLGADLQESTVAEAQAKRDDDHAREGDPDLRSCETVIGYHLHANDGDVGHVEGFLIDDETWAIRYLVVNTSHWWHGHRVLMAPNWITRVGWEDQSVTVDLSRDAVKAAPVYDLAAAVDRPHEHALYTHYGRPPYWETDASLAVEV